jgi:hypothetical protein
MQTQIITSSLGAKPICKQKLLNYSADTTFVRIFHVYPTACSDICL